MVMAYFDLEDYEAAAASILDLLGATVEQQPARGESVAAQ